MTEQKIEPSIIHLDFPVEEAEDKPEPVKRCGLYRPHPNDPTMEECGRKASYLISLVKPCGHNSTLYLCEGCWKKVELVPGHTWQCRTKDCGVQFVVKTAIVKWERL